MVATHSLEFVLDCPDPQTLARFYGRLLEGEVSQFHDHWFRVTLPGGAVLGFQEVEGYTPPDWPGQDIPQQAHLDVYVDDLDESEAAALELGATKHTHQPGETFRVFLDPAGHPFCLCQA